MGAAAGAQVLLLLLVLVPRVAVPVLCRGLAGVGERCSQGWHAQAGRSAPRTAPSLCSICALSPLVSSQTMSNKKIAFKDLLCFPPRAVPPETHTCL